MSDLPTECSYDALLEVMRRRRSVRRFQARPVPRELLEQALEAARWAPSAGNRQAYRLLVVRAPATIASLASAVRAVSEELVGEARPDRSEELATYVGYFDRFEGAPLLVVPIYRSGGVELAPGLARAAPDGLATAAAAMMNLLLALHALGLGACWMTGPLIAEPALRRLLAVPEGWSIAALIPVGYPDEAPAAPPRRPLQQLVRYLDDEGEDEA